MKQHALLNIATGETSDEINDNVLAGLGKHDRICEVSVDNVTDGELAELAGAMEVTFPALKYLYIHSSEGNLSFPDSFLGGSAPNLQSLHLKRIAFLALPNLLLSSPGVTSLSISDIPHSGYIPSDVVVDCLSSLTRLKFLQIKFQSSQPRPDRGSQRQPPLTHTVYPVLTILILEGVTEYLDHILAHIEAPLLDYAHIRFIDPPIFVISRIAPCIGHTETIEAFDRAYMHFHRHGCFNVVLSSRNGTTGDKILTLSLQWEDPGWKLRELTLDSRDHLFEPFDLCDLEGLLLPSWAKNMGNAPWLHLIRFFTTTESMYLTQGLAVRVAPALQELTGAGITEVLPLLQNIFVERLDSLGPVKVALRQFVAARQLLSGKPVDVQCWVSGESINRSGHQ